MATGQIENAAGRRWRTGGRGAALGAGMALAGVVALVLALCRPCAGAAESPQAVIQDTTVRLLRALKREHEIVKQNPGRIYELVEEILLPVVDTGNVSRLVLGKYWRRATPQQRTRFSREFQTRLIRTYSASLLDYTDVEITYLPMPTVGDGTDATVRTRIRYGVRDPLAVDYRLRLADGKWLVYDVTVAGVSAVTTFRKEFAGEIERFGIEALIRKLAEQNEQRRRTVKAPMRSG